MGVLGAVVSIIFFVSISRCRSLQHFVIVCDKLPFAIWLSVTDQRLNTKSWCARVTHVLDFDLDTCIENINNNPFAWMRGVNKICEIVDI
jgi:hypothetical protein